MKLLPLEKQRELLLQFQAEVFLCMRVRSFWTDSHETAMFPTHSRCHDDVGNVNYYAQVIKSRKLLRAAVRGQKIGTIQAVKCLKEKMESNTSNLYHIIVQFVPESLDAARVIPPSTLSKSSSLVHGQGRQDRQLESAKTSFATWVGSTRFKGTARNTRT